MKSAWSTFFPADRFALQLGEWAGSQIAYHPKRGDGFIFGGPYRFLPGAEMRARFIFSGHFGLGSSQIGKALGTGHIILEVTDALGIMHARAEIQRVARGPLFLTGECAEKFTAKHRGFFSGHRPWLGPGAGRRFDGGNFQCMHRHRQQSFPVQQAQ